MTYHPSLILSIAFAAAVIVGAPLLRAADFPQAESDLRPDSGVRFGELPNGVGYVILENHEPEDRASLRLVVGAGSFNETAAQRGYAHVIARMAFRGSAHYPPGTLGAVLERWGMGTEPEENSKTDFAHTDFVLELPDTRASTLKQACGIFADFSGGLLLRDDQIDADRPTILGELAQRDSAAYRDQIAEMRFTLPDTIIPDRVPIGKEETVRRANHGGLAAFYDAWYRPEKITVIAVGDFDPSAVEQMIADAFGSLRDRAPALPAPKLGDIPVVGGLQTSFLPEPGARAVRISVETITPYYHEADTIQKRLENLKRGLAFAMLNQRLGALAKRGDTPLLSAAADVGEQFDFMHSASLQLICRPEDWSRALAAGEQELRRALTYGFQPAELAAVVAGMRKTLQQAVNGASTRTSKRLADNLVHSLAIGQVFTSPSANLAVYGAALDTLTPEDCTAALRAAWAAKGTYLLVAGNLALKHPDEELAAAYQGSRAVAVQPPAKVTARKFPYVSFGTPGRVVSRTEVKDLGITEVIFSNGVRLNLKATKFEPGKIGVSVRIGGGGLTEPADAQPGLARFTEGVFSAAGLGALSVQDIQAVLAGKTVGFEFRVLDDAFSFTGGTDSTDYPVELQLITAYLTDPGYRADAQEKARRAIPQMYRSLDQTPDIVLETRIARLMANGDPRFGLPAQDDLMARNLSEMKAWLTPQFASGPVEVAMVGDLDVDQAIDAVAATLGALPQRAPKPSYSAERLVSFPPKAISRVFPSSAAAGWCSVLIVWPTTDGHDARTAHRLGLLSAIFSSRLRTKLHDAPSGGRCSGPPPTSSGTGFSTWNLSGRSRPPSPRSRSRRDPTSIG
jgi:zinc protease